MDSYRPAHRSPREASAVENSAVSGGIMGSEGSRRAPRKNGDDVARVIRLLVVAGLVVSAGCKESEGSAIGGETVTLRDSIESSPAKEIVLRARAFDRADNLDSARALYEE